MGKWFAGIAASVIAAVLGWWVLGLLNSAPPDPPPLIVSAWYVPEPAIAGKTIDIFVKVLQEDDTPVPNANIKLTPVSGTFTWAGSGNQSITGVTDQNGLFSFKFQTVLQVGVIGSDTSPGNSRTGTISVYTTKTGFDDSRIELNITTVN